MIVFPDKIIFFDYFVGFSFQLLINLFNISFQLMFVKITKLCPMQKEKKPTKRSTGKLNVTTNSMAGIVSKVMQGQKWRPHVHRGTDVVEASQVG